MTDATPALPRRRNRNWIWVFAALGLMGATALGVNWAYNAGQPLTDDEFRAARQRWGANRPADYDLKITRAASYASSDGTGGTTVDKIDVSVRGGKVTGFLLNGREPEPLLTLDGRRNIDEERRQRESYDIDGLFAAIEEFIEMDRRENRRTFMRARFDKKDGHVTMFTRQVKGKRVPHVQVEMKKVN